jgi:hypothetical protein
MARWSGWSQTGRSAFASDSQAGSSVGSSRSTPSTLVPICTPRIRLWSWTGSVFQRGRDVLQREGGEPVEPVWPAVAEIGRGVVLDSGEVAADLGRHVIVEVRRRDRDHLDVDLLSVHGFEAEVWLEHGLGEWP